MGIDEINIPKRNACPSNSPLVHPFLMRSYGDVFNSTQCRGMRPFPSPTKSPIWDQHRQAPGMRGKWPTKEQLILLRDSNIVSQKDLLTKSPWQLQKKRKSIKEEELDRIRKQCGQRRDLAKERSQLVNQQVFDNWLKGKIKARKEEALDHLRQLKVEEDRKSLFAEYIERKNIDEVEHWLMNKMSLVEEVIDAKNMSKEMQKWYEAQKESMKEKLLKMWGYQYFRSLPNVDVRRSSKFSGYVTPGPKWAHRQTLENKKISTNLGKIDHQVKFA
ncbi:unnamed protein product [Nezara viridula]|uniref:Uncharacterized protein n=1 Tax=Nezara viridula TaxID=85310 RepID=A0A9P0HBC5_NEZVI|nr:unnamed protein product [Nezara viridula]